MRGAARTGGIIPLQPMHHSVGSGIDRGVLDGVAVLKVVRAGTRVPFGEFERLGGSRIQTARISRDEGIGGVPDIRILDDQRIPIPPAARDARQLPDALW